MMIVRGIGLATLLLLLGCSYLLTTPFVTAFCPSTVAPSVSLYAGNVANRGSQMSFPQSTLYSPMNPSQGQRAKSTQLNFMGSDGGILGIGAPELFTILLVGYFVLGPEDLYKLVKEIGKLVQNFRTFSADATATFENTFEDQLQLQEIRKAQQELNDAFSFRRSINVDESTEAFEVNAQSPRDTSDIGSIPEAPVAAALGTERGVDGAPRATEVIGTNGTKVSDVVPAPKKKIRRRVKKKVAQPQEGELPVSAATTGPLANDVPDLDMSEEDAFFMQSEESAMKSLEDARAELKKERDEMQRQERIQRLSNADEAWEAEQAMDSSEGYDSSVTGSEVEYEKASQARFQAQMSGNWNDQIVAKTDELQPMETIMQKIALLEEEKNKADERLKEEFRLRQDNEEEYYREKRRLLEEAVSQVQASALGPKQ